MIETARRRQNLLLIGFFSVLFLLLVGPSIIAMYTMVPRQKEVIFRSPGDSISINNGEWFCMPFMIDDDQNEYMVGVEGVLFSHNKNDDDIKLEFGFAHMSLTSFMSLSDSDMIDSFEGYGSGGGWDSTGTEYASGYFGVSLVGEYVWAIRFIDQNNSSAVFQTDFEVILQTM